MPKPAEQRGELARSSWRDVAKRTFREFRDDNLTDLAAALTYYAVLSLFPGLLVLVAIIGLAGQHPETTNAVLRIIDDVGPSSAVETFEDPVRGVLENKGGAGALLGVGLLGALWTASGYIGAFMRASNAIYEVEEGRPFWKLRPLQVGVTMVLLLLLALVAIGFVVSGPIAEEIGDSIGVGDTALTVWDTAKWPVLVAIVMAVFATLFHIAPNVRRPNYRLITAGGALAVLVWIAASVGFAFYVGNFGSYNATYGTLGGVIVFLVWLWISNIALLLGVELDAELERERELVAGLDAEQRILLPPRERAEAG